MYKKTAFALCACLWSYISFAQTGGIKGILQQIEQNNSELKALTEYMKGQKLQLKSSNNLPDPQLGAYYLPFGEHTTSDYTEFQLSQSFEFPTVYGLRNKLIDRQKDGLTLEYESKRQKILMEAEQNLLEVIALNKRNAHELNRLKQAKTVFEQSRELFNKGQTGILELNKAKVAWMQLQFVVQQTEVQKRNKLLKLKNLNGGKELVVIESSFTEDLNLPEKESIWRDRLSSDPELRYFRQEEAIAEQELKLARNKLLPDLSLGYNYQGVSGNNYSGFYGGLSIPLWNNRNKVKSAKSQLSFRQSNTNVQTQIVYTTFEEQFNNYQALLKRYLEYQATLEGLDNESLLFKAYKLGEISFTEYYIELQFFHEAYDSMLEMEKQLYQLKATILKHQL